MDHLPSRFFKCLSLWKTKYFQIFPGKNSFRTSNDTGPQLDATRLNPFVRIQSWWNPPQHQVRSRHLLCRQMIGLQNSRQESKTTGLHPTTLHRTLLATSWQALLQQPLNALKKTLEMKSTKIFFMEIRTWKTCWQSNSFTNVRSKRIWQTAESHNKT